MRKKCNGWCFECENPDWMCMFHIGNFFYVLKVKCPYLPLIISIIALLVPIIKEVLCRMT